MKILKQLFKVLEKQGLIDGSLTYRDRRFVFSREAGIKESAAEGSQTQREPLPGAQEVEIDLKKKVSTIRRGKKSSEPQLEYREDKLSGAAEASASKAKMSTRWLLRLTVVFVVLAVGLMILIIGLNKKMSEDQTVLMETGETENGFKDDIINGSGHDQLSTEGPETPGEPSDDQTPIKKDKGESGDGLRPEAGDQPVNDPRQKPESEVKKPQDKQIPAFRDTVSIRDLSPALIRKYNQHLMFIRIELPRRTKVSGTVNIKFYINKDGEVYQFQLSSEGLTVKPQSRQNTVILRIKRAISTIRLDPPVDKYQRKVSVHNWRLNYMVTQFKKRMILRKQ
jgi:hypothetical protein